MRDETGRVTKLCERFDRPAHAHELTFTCYHNLPLLGKDRSRQWFVNALSIARQRHAFDIWAYVIMPDHAHLLIFARTGTPSPRFSRQSNSRSHGTRCCICEQRRLSGSIG